MAARGTNRKVGWVKQTIGCGVALVALSLLACGGSGGDLKGGASGSGAGGNASSGGTKGAGASSGANGSGAKSNGG
ncbi:MAG TPA: hypothetical protein VEQ59_19980, partial [Polyangiaceae bacterium]|nr:hypothetical protein [Polyangiaceae bacterium]